MQRLNILALGLLVTTVWLAASPSPALAEQRCETYLARGGLYFVDNRAAATQIRSSHGYYGISNIAPAANARIKLDVELPQNMPPIDSFTVFQRQNGSVRTWAGFGEYEFFVDLDGTWEIGIEFCGDGFIAPQEPAEFVVMYEFDAPKWRTVDAAGHVYTLAAPFPAYTDTILPDGSHVAEFDDMFTFPQYAEGDAMETFQTLRESHLFTEFDADCQVYGQGNPCGYNLGGHQLTYYVPGPEGMCTNHTKACTLHGGLVAASPTDWESVHEFGHVRHLRVASYVPDSSENSPYENEAYNFKEDLAYAFRDAFRRTERTDGPTCMQPVSGSTYLKRLFDPFVNDLTPYGVENVYSDQVWVNQAELLDSLSRLNIVYATIPPYHLNVTIPLEEDAANSSDQAWLDALEDLREGSCL